MKPTLPFPHDEIAPRGEAIYERAIRPRVENDYKDWVLAIDVMSEAWEMSRDVGQALEQLKRKQPDSVPFCMRIGHPSLHSIGYWKKDRGE